MSVTISHVLNTFTPEEKLLLVEALNMLYNTTQPTPGYAWRQKGDAIKAEQVLALSNKVQS